MLVLFGAGTGSTICVDGAEAGVTAPFPGTKLGIGGMHGLAVGESLGGTSPSTGPSFCSCTRALGIGKIDRAGALVVLAKSLSPGELEGSNRISE
jgi:hypothetical protein